MNRDAGGLLFGSRDNTAQDMPAAGSAQVDAETEPRRECLDVST